MQREDVHRVVGVGGDVHAAERDLPRAAAPLGGEMLAGMVDEDAAHELRTPVTAVTFRSTLGLFETTAMLPAVSSRPPAIQFLIVSSSACGSLSPLGGMAGSSACMTRRYSRLPSGSPGSMTFEVQDIPAIAQLAHAVEAFVVLDNTWATPMFFRPFEHGVDVSIQAATKYIVGHSDALLGIATANERAWPKLQLSAHHFGETAGPDDIFLALRGLRTMAVRLQRHWR